LVNSFFEALSFFLRYRLPLGYISAVGVGGARRSQSPKINSASKKELTELVKSFFEALSFFLRYRLPLGYISAVGVGGARRIQSPIINTTSKKDLTHFLLIPCGE
jgi:hypothetical protein